jgi:hypothetical protein
MMQDNTKTEEGENINPETKSPSKNNQKNNAPALKPPKTVAAKPRACTEVDENDINYLWG